jgi:pimeloyl-ACP methyl ester carboxylesterase
VALSEKLFQLENGRCISAILAGDESMRTPVLYFHGLPGSGLELAIFDAEARLRGLSLIAIERPGLGQSDYYASRKIGDIVEDVRAVLELMRIEKTSILAVSGGTPYSLFCAERLKDQIISLNIVSGTAPPEHWINKKHFRLGYRLMFTLGKTFPNFMNGLASLTLHLLRYIPSVGLFLFKKGLNKDDQDLLSRPAEAALFKRNFLRAMQNGVKGVVKDFFLFIDDWKIGALDFTGQICIWHGKEDRVLPYALSTKLASLYRDNVKLYRDNVKLFDSNKGHFMIVDLAPQILEMIAKPHS